MNKSLANHKKIVTKVMIGVHRHGSWTSFRQPSPSPEAAKFSLDEPTFRAATLKEDEQIITPKLPIAFAIKDWSAALTILLTFSAGANRDAAAWIIRAFQVACPEEETLCDVPPFVDP